MYRLQLKSATKGEFLLLFFIYFLSLIVSSRRHGMQMANEADEVLLVSGLVNKLQQLKKEEKEKKNAI